MKFLAPIPSQFLDETGTPYSSGSVSVYIHGEPRLADIYQNASGNELAPNPFTLDSHGMWMAFVDSGKSYDYLVKDAGGNVVAPYYNVVVPGTEGVSGVSIESPRGTIEVTESVVGGRKEFGIDVNADSFAHSHGSFSHDAVVGASGSFDYDSFTEVGVEGDDIYLSQGRLTLDSGLYHVSVNVLLENSAEDGNSYDVSFEIDGTQFKKSWDNTFVHSETVEVGIDISVDEDGHAVVPSISGLPEGMSCVIPRLDVHRVDGLCVGSSSSTVEHDSTLEGDGSHDNPLSVKDYSLIRSDLAGVIEGLADHETDPGAHQDIRNELSLKENKSNKVTEWSETLSDDNYPSEKLVKDSLDEKYAKPSSGIPKTDLASGVQTSLGLADSAIQGVSVNGTALTPDSNKAVDVSVPTSSNATPLMDGSAAAGVGTHWARGDHRHPTDTSREAVNNKVQSINDTSTTDYPSSKAVADFVNSSVATNTAAFLGNFSLEDLGLTYPATEVQIASALNSHTWPTGYPTNNDYVYVEIRNPQSTIDDKVQRYKYRDGLASWGYEYTLNNSSFTAEEKASIDSGITSQDVTNLRADHTTLDTHVADTSNPHQVTAAQVGAEPAFSVLPVSKGGTGKTTERDAANNLIYGLNSSSTAITSPDCEIITGDAAHSSGNLKIFYKRTVSALWSYIKGQISSVLGLSELGYTGNAATATSAGFATSATSASSATLATTATNYASGGGIDTALQGKLGTSGDGSNVLVTPDGTSTGTDIGISTTLKAWAQKFKNLVVSLGTAAFKNVPSSGNASTSEVVMGNDTRLTDARTPTSHTHDDRYYTESEVNTLLNNKLNTNGDASNTTVTRDGITTDINIPNSAITLSAFAQKVKNIATNLTTSVLWGYCESVASVRAKRVVVHGNISPTGIKDYTLICIHFVNGNTYNAPFTTIVFNFYRAGSDTLWFSKEILEAGWLNHIVAGDYLFILGPGDKDIGFIKSYTQETYSSENAKNYIAGGNIQSGILDRVQSITLQGNQLCIKKQDVESLMTIPYAHLAGTANRIAYTTKYYGSVDASTTRCLCICKMANLVVNEGRVGCIKVMIYGGSYFKMMEISFRIVRTADTTALGQVKLNSSNVGTPFSGSIYLIRTNDFSNAYLVIATKATAQQYMSATYAPLFFAFGDIDDTSGNTVSDVIGTSNFSIQDVTAFTD